MSARRLKPHENLIFHLIESQSTTHQTALRELVQNAYDAGATECLVELTATGFSVQDNGRGFTSEDEIERFFETFGTPHAEDDTGRFGRFRMGRCQIMAYAPTTWRSGAFRMEVDFKNHGLDYELVQDQPPVHGCRISGTWYSGLAKHRVEDIAEELRQSLEYFYRLPVYLNGRRISKNLDELTITAENEDFYVVTQTNRLELSIYNLGIYVSPLQVANARWHLRGLLLSKNHLDLDITRKHWRWQGSECFERLDALLSQHFPVIQGRGKLRSHQIQAVLHALRQHETTIDAIQEFKLFHDPARTRFYTLNDLCRQVFTFVRPGDDEFMADKLNQWGQVPALAAGDVEAVFGGGTTERSIELFFNVLARQARHPTEPEFEGNSPGVYIAYHVAYHYESFDKVIESLDDEHAFVAEEQLTPQEQCALKALRMASKQVLEQVGRYRSLDWVDAGQRRVEVGLASGAAAWTDGTNYIAVHQQQLGRLREGIRGADYLAAVLVHEWCHQASNPREHNAEFYRSYHDLTTHPELGLLTRLALEINAQYGRYLRLAGLSVPAAVLRHLTGRAAQTERQQQPFVKLLGQYAELEEQFGTVERYLLASLICCFEPERVPAPVREALQQVLQESSHVSDYTGYRYLNRSTDWVQLKEAPVRFTARNAQALAPRREKVSQRERGAPAHQELLKWLFRQEYGAAAEEIFGVTDVTEE